MSHKLEFDSIQVAFGGRKLLGNIYMVSETGSVTGLLGRNGCGKTTLMKIVFGAIPFEQKSVRINSRSLGLNYLSRNLIAYLPQDALIPPYLSIRQAFSLFNIPPMEIFEFFPEATDMMDLRSGELSGGYRRIFELLLVLKSKALFCLLDEPFSGLTPVYIERIKAILNGHKAHKGILITDHLHRHVVEIADELYVLANGQTYHVREHEQLVSLGYVNHL
jgi:ABC-type multidrug transport system ATPase subunit